MFSTFYIQNSWFFTEYSLRARVIAEASLITVKLYHIFRYDRFRFLQAFLEGNIRAYLRRDFYNINFCFARGATVRILVFAIVVANTWIVSRHGCSRRWLAILPFFVHLYLRSMLLLARWEWKLTCRFGDREQKEKTSEGRPRKSRWMPHLTVPGRQKSSLGFGSTVAQYVSVGGTRDAATGETPQKHRCFSSSVLLCSRGPPLALCHLTKPLDIGIRFVCACSIRHADTEITRSRGGPY